MNDTLELLMAQIEERRKAIIESLGDGAAKDYPAYREAAGMVRGLLTAQSLIADLANRMENSDE
jgi:hypothetical protein